MAEAAPDDPVARAKAIALKFAAQAAAPSLAIGDDSSAAQAGSTMIAMNSATPSPAPAAESGTLDERMLIPGLLIFPCFVVGLALIAREKVFGIRNINSPETLISPLVFHKYLISVEPIDSWLAVARSHP